MTGRHDATLDDRGIGLSLDPAPKVILIAGRPRLRGETVDVRTLSCLPRNELRGLEGRFAVVRRESDGSLVMARDGSGFFPIYVDAAEGRAASSPQELATSRARRLDLRGLANYVVTSQLPAPLTIWEGIIRCPAGSLLHVRRGAVERVPLLERHPRTRSEAARQLLAMSTRQPELEAIAAGEALRPRDERRLEAWSSAFLMDALRRGLAGTSQLLLSGGIDSTILAFLASERGRRLRTFTFGASPQDPWSDGPLRASPVAARIGSDHEELSVGPEAYVASLDDYLGALSEPSLSSYLPFLVARHLGGRGSWIFGMGADEIFLGDPWYAKLVRARRAAALLARVPAALRHAAMAAARPLEPRVPGLAKKIALLGERDPDFRFLYAFSRDNLDVSERLALLAPEVRPPGFSRDDANFARGDPESGGLEAMQEMLLVHEFPDGHGQDLAHFHRGLDLELPYFARDVVAAALVVRPEQRARPGKLFLREAARDVVPADLLRSPKGSFVMPAVAWLRGALAPLVEERLSPRRLRRRGIWNVPEVTARLARFREGKASPFDVIRVLHLELWMDRHGVS